MESEGIKTISTEQLKARLDRGDDFKLVMAFDDWRFRAAHIPGSIGVGSPAAAMQLLRPEDDVVVYCSSDDCLASKLLYRALLAAGFKRVRRYSGGVVGWQEAGFELEGDRLT